ncbi:MAG TPA: GAF domain-containing protein [Anaerolineales bacterium]|nr:GAF domain-containing protein [Anaerolineales bacterium]
MMNPSKSNHLKSIHKLLKSLERQPDLPVETTRLAAQATESLTHLTALLAEGEEQSRLAALYGVSSMLGGSLNLNEVLNQVMDAVIELTRAERGFLVLVTPESGDLVLRAARNFVGESLSEENMQVSRTVIDTVIRSGEGVVTTNAQEDPRFARRESVITFALRSILCAPLRSRGSIIGAVFVDNRVQTGLFDEADLSMLNAFASQAAVAIESARLYTQTDQTLAARVDELEILSQIDRELNRQLELDHIVDTTLEWAKRGTQASGGWIALYERDGTTLARVSEPDRGAYLSSSEPVVAQTLANGTPTAFPPGSNNAARLAIPLQTSHPLGILVVEAAEPFSEEASKFLGRLASRAATAMENAQLFQAVQDANQAKSNFVSVVSHELRIPMTSIKGYTDLLLQGMMGPLTDPQKNFLDVIRNNVERMRVLVSDLSDISRIETGRLRLENAALPLHGLVEQVVKSLQPKMEEKEQTLQVNVPEDLPRCYADPNRVIQVLTNLVSNSWKYTETGGQIVVTGRLDGTHLCVEVTDNGLGISDEDQAKIFTQFYRSEDEKVRAETGWGLGLSVTKNLVELMGGEIGFRSSLGEGSTFWFTVPVVES